MQATSRIKPLTVATVLFAISCAAGFGDALVRTQAMRATTIAEFYVEAGTLLLELEIGSADLPGFRNLMPDELYVEIAGEERPFAERFVDFYSRDLVIRADGGKPLIGELRGLDLERRVSRDDITGEPVPPAEGEEAEQVITAVIRYPLPESPATIALSPPVDEAGRASSATIGFVVYHQGVAVNDFRYLSGEEVLDLDREDPWYSRFRNRNLKRQFSEPAQAFIYVEPYEVRKEILIRPHDLQHWVDLGLEDKTTIPASDQAALKEKVARLLGERCPATVDGEAVAFELDRVHFVRRTLRKTTVIEEAEDLPLVSAIVGVIYVHRRDGLPQKAALTWDLFHDKLTSVSGATHDEAGPFPWTVTPDDPVLEWTNYLKNPTLPSFVEIAPPPPRPTIHIPVVSVVFLLVASGGLIAWRRRGNDMPRLGRAFTLVSLVGIILAWPLARRELARPFSSPPQVSEEQAIELISGLLRNIYRAFDYRDEEVIYDSLARSVSGDLLSEIYIDVHKALVLQSQGGAKVKVDRLQMLDAVREALPDSPGFEIRCRWNVSGKVNHWGHVHTRTNQYEATYVVEPIGGSWRITGQDLVGARRVT